MTFDLYILLILTVLGLLFCSYLVRFYGLQRGVLAGMSRVLWLTPFVLMFFPRNEAKEIGASVSNTLLRVFVDDSDSMTKSKARRQLNQSVMNKITESCRLNGCQIKITRLSELDSQTSSGFSNLNDALSAWMLSIGGDPWIAVTDGGDSRPSRPWNERLHEEGKNRGLIVSFDDLDHENLWIERVESSPLAFEHKNIVVNVTVRRGANKAEKKSVQVQIESEKTIIETQNVEFEAGQDEVTQEFVVSALTKGQHTLTANLVPSPGEKAIWDNQKNFSIDVLPNTVGVLHILGSPSWDGRFLRRFLKSEPKFDLISFYILRDPWDNQQIDERELSLIPFPVDRLFKEELQNFRVLIIQNFSMFQFMIAEHQENLVRFVQNGGGLLFIGGPRALSDQDLRGSPLKSILPFDYNPERQKAFPELDMIEQSQISASYQPKTEFEIKLAKPDLEARTQASIYEDFLPYKESLESIKNLRGLHQTKDFHFKDDRSTRILEAQTKDGGVSPLLVASYPEQGRALWLFSDSFWQIALSKSPMVTRNLYNQVFLTSLRWLMRDEARSPVTVRDIMISQTRQNTLSWTARVSGPSVRYFRDKSNVKVNLCNIEVPANALNVHIVSVDNIILSGEMKSKLSKEQSCRAVFDFSSPATGKIKVNSVALIPSEFSDKEIQGSLQKIRELQVLTGADLMISPNDRDAKIDSFIEQFTQRRSPEMTSKIKNFQDHFWIFDQWYCYVLLAFAIVEVVVRRWDKLFT